MDKEQDKTIEVLEFAVQMEIDGKEFYKKAGTESTSKVGKDLFEWLAGEEDKHRKRFEEIYAMIKEKKGWPEKNPEPQKKHSIKTLFSEALQKSGRLVKAEASELELIDKAMEMEKKTHDFYKNMGKGATYQAEKKYYESLAAEEHGHFLLLNDYREYIIDPAGWFVKEEHHSLDGG
jgi:rubrerythrin